MKGKAARTWADVEEPKFYSLVPDDFWGVAPKVVVKVCHNGTRIFVYTLTPATAAPSWISRVKPW